MSDPQLELNFDTPAPSSFGDEAAWREARLSRKRARNRKHYQKNVQQYVDRAKEWAIRNPERRREIVKRYDDGHRVQIKLWRAENKEKLRAMQQAWAANNKENTKAYRRRPDVREKDLARQRAAYKANPEKWKVRYEARRSEVAAYMRQRRKTDPVFKIKCLLSSRLWKVLKRHKSHKAAATIALFGCSAQSLKDHLERQFTRGMTWDNHGIFWEVDHILPFKSFPDLSQIEQQRLVSHWTNLRPLRKKENSQKSARITLDHNLALLLD